jgi:hypothetical protein
MSDQPTNPAAKHHELEAAREPMRSEWRDVVDRIQVLVLRTRVRNCLASERPQLRAFVENEETRRSGRLNAIWSRGFIGAWDAPIIPAI